MAEFKILKLCLFMVAAEMTTPLAAEPVPEIVVTARPSSQTEADLAKCLAGACSPEADINASLAHAENQFVAGNYKGARETLRTSIDRNRQYAPRFPVAVSNLYRANANILEHMGELVRFRHSMVAMRDTLKNYLPANDPRALAAELEMGDFLFKTGAPEKAAEKYLSVERDALAVNAPRIAALGRLRYLSFLLRVAEANEHDTLIVKKARTEIEDYVAHPTSGAERYAVVGRVLLARLDRLAGDQRSTDALIAEIVAQGGSERPVLLYAPPMNIDEAKRFQPDKWIDVGFWVDERGHVEEPEVLRSGGKPDWAEIVLEAVGKRIYAPAAGKDGETHRSFMVERYTLTAYWTWNTGSRAKVRSRSPRIERLDLTP